MVLVCGTCVWFLCVVLVCGACVWFLCVVLVCGTCVAFVRSSCMQCLCLVSLYHLSGTALDCVLIGVEE